MVDDGMADQPACRCIVPIFTSRSTPSREMTGRSAIENGLVADAVSPTVMTAVSRTASAISPFAIEVRRRATTSAKANFVPEMTPADRRIP